VLEKYRTYKAALELQEFTIRDIALESGVSEPTVQKILIREKQLFEKVGTRRSSPRGAGSKVYRANREIVLARMRDVARLTSAPPLSLSGLSADAFVEMARETLQVTFFEAEVEIRSSLLGAARQQLMIGRDCEDQESYQDLARLLRSLDILHAVARIEEPRDHLASTLPFLRFRSAIREILNEKPVGHAHSTTFSEIVTGALGQMQLDASVLIPILATASLTASVFSAAWDLVSRDFWTARFPGIAKTLFAPADKAWVTETPKAPAIKHYGVFTYGHRSEEHYPALFTTSRSGWFPLPSHEKTDEEKASAVMLIHLPRAKTSSVESLNSAVELLEIDLSRGQILRGVRPGNRVGMHNAVPFNELEWEGNGYHISGFNYPHLLSTPIIGPAVTVASYERDGILRISLPTETWIPLHAGQEAMGNLRYNQADFELGRIAHFDILTASGHILFTYYINRQLVEAQVNFADLIFDPQRRLFLISPGGSGSALHRLSHDFFPLAHATTLHN
jgi:hypothetical protein